MSKKTVASTKLAEKDELLSVHIVDPVGSVLADDMDMGGMINFMDDGGSIIGGSGEMDNIMDTGEIPGIVVLQTEKGLFLRFPLADVPEKKKGAIGVRGMKLSKEDAIAKVYVMDAGDNLEVEVNRVKVELRKLKLKKRDQAGQKGSGR